MQPLRNETRSAEALVSESTPDKPAASVPLVTRPVHRRLPPLNALRSFEAAARHLSFARAAGELHVTPAAISHQVKVLEDYLAIRYGAGRYAGLVVEKLLDEIVFPVCSPKLLKGKQGLRHPEQLRHLTLLHDDSPDDDESCPTWEMWLRAAGVSDVDHTRGPRFNQSSLVLEAAILGRGVALAK